MAVLKSRHRPPGVSTLAEHIRELNREMNLANHLKGSASYAWGLANFGLAFCFFSLMELSAPVDLTAE